MFRVRRNLGSACFEFGVNNGLLGSGLGGGEWRDRVGGLGLGEFDGWGLS
jgi:hypothetical protein